MSTDSTEHPPLVRRPFINTWHGTWTIPKDFPLPEPKGDFRDTLPPPLEVLHKEYRDAGITVNGAWTLGLCDCWAPRGRIIKHTVHLPCFNSFKWNPLKWRGIVFGRNLKECFLFAFKESRWSRYVIAAQVGREYNCPTRCFGKCFNIREERNAVFLILLFQACRVGIGCGLEAVAPLISSHCINLLACCTCHSREKIRRKYNLPSAFCLPPGIDDCLVHFFCMYCASHQEMRELAVRGVDGPGLHVLDITPEDWKHLEGWEEAVEARKARVRMLAGLPLVFPSMEERMTTNPGWLQTKIIELRGSKTVITQSGSIAEEHAVKMSLMKASTPATDDAMSEANGPGIAPSILDMDRDGLAAEAADVSSSIAIPPIAEGKAAVVLDKVTVTTTTVTHAPVAPVISTAGSGSTAASTRNSAAGSTIASSAGSVISSTTGNAQTAAVLAAAVVPGPIVAVHQDIKTTLLSATTIEPAAPHH